MARDPQDTLPGYPDTPPGFIRTPADVSLFTLAMQHVQMQGALAQLAQRMDDREDRREEREEALRESMRGVVAAGVRDALAPLTKRVDELEGDLRAQRGDLQAQTAKLAKVTYTTGGVAMAAGALGWLWEHFGKVIAPLFLFVLTGCIDSGGPGRVGEDLTGPRWCEEERPAFVVLDPELSDECAEAVIEAAEFWREQGVGYLTVVSGETLLSPVPRQIQIVPELPTDLGAAGTTQLHRVTTSCIDGAEIRLAACRKQTAAHELGHALGLGHSDDETNLMWFAAVLNRDGPYGLTDAQREHVR